MVLKTKKVEEEIKTKQKKANKDVFLDYLPYIIIILIIIIIRTFIATPIRVNGTSMETTLHNGETMILNKLGMKTSGINRWDIIVLETDSGHLIKRVIGMPGESIKYLDGILYIDNQEIEDNYSLTTTDDFEEVIIGQNEYFVMGDNRYLSQDSRVIGPVKKEDIKGKTNIILFPLDRFGIIKK
ncbi:MAG: signal peptidase I [Bacilli bacterium]|nr:signal peptidase I [Bacilli bacterium]